MVHHAILKIITLALLWGPSLTYVKIALYEATPILVATLRISFAALVILVLLKFPKALFKYSRQTWTHATIQGFFSAGMPFVLFAFAMNTIESSLGSIIIGITPLLTILLSYFMLPQESLNPYKIVGICLGGIGFLFLVLPTLLDGEVAADTYGILMSFISSSSYAFGIVYTKRNLGRLPPLNGTALQMLSASCYLIPLSFLFEDPCTILPAMSWSSWLAVAMLAVPGAALSFWLYFHIVAVHGTVALSMVTYLLPVVGAFTGVIFLQETFHWNYLVATLFILSGMACANATTATLPFKYQLRRQQEKL